MGVKEFIAKTCLFIVVPGGLVYGCLREQDDIAHYHTMRRAGIALLQDPAVNALTITEQVADGHLVHRRVTDTAALQKVRLLAKGLRPVRLGINTYRLSIRQCTFTLMSDRDTCELVLRKMPAGHTDLLAAAGDSAYEAPHFITLLDSLFLAAKAERPS